jgi:hypothetical protein
MAYLARQRLNHYKRFKIDIWGFFKNTLQVLHDKTIYKNYKAGKFFRRLTYLWKPIKWGYRKEKYKAIQMEKLYKIKKIDQETIKNIRKEFYALKRKRLCYLIKLINYNNLWFNFMKTVITKRLSIIIQSFMKRRVKQIKIFYRRPFIYESRISSSGVRRKRINAMFLTLRYIKLFYLIYSFKQLKKIAHKAKFQDGVFEHNYLLIIESKLPSYIYRTSFFPTLFDSLDFVKGGNVWINKKYNPNIHFCVKLNDIVGFRVLYKSYIFWSFYRRLRRKAFLFIFSRCIFVSFKFLFTILISRFTKRDIINSFNFDYYRVANYIQ